MAHITLLCKCSYHLQKVENLFIATVPAHHTAKLLICICYTHIQPLIIECCSVSPDVVGSLSHLQTQAVVDLQDLALGLKHSTAVHERDCTTRLTGLTCGKNIGYWSLYQGVSGPLPHSIGIVLPLLKLGVHYETQCLTVYKPHLRQLLTCKHAHDLYMCIPTITLGFVLAPFKTKQCSQYKCIHLFTVKVMKVSILQQFKPLLLPFLKMSNAHNPHIKCCRDTQCICS